MCCILEEMSAEELVHATNRRRLDACYVSRLGFNFSFLILIILIPLRSSRFPHPTRHGSRFRRHGGDQKGTGSEPFGFPKLIGIKMNARMHNSYCTMRVQTAKEICKLVLQHGALLIRAPPGSGKTSLLQLVAQTITPDMFKDVYYINLAHLASSETTIEQLWEEAYGRDVADIVTVIGSSSKKPTLLLVDEGGKQPLL